MQAAQESHVKYERSQEDNLFTRQQEKFRPKRLLETLRFGNEAFNGVDLFEGTEPLRQGGATGESHRPNVLGDDPTDAGVDISSIMGNAGKIWQAIK